MVVIMREAATEEEVARVCAGVDVEEVGASAHISPGEGRVLDLARWTGKSA
jgi:hypothetical protein